MPASKWLFDIRSNNGGAIPNATALGSAWMTRDVSSAVNTVFYVKAPVGGWRTKGLRQVAETGPYMRDGQIASLDEVVELHDRGGDPAGSFLGGPKEIHPLHLSTQEKKDLVELLGTLTSQPLAPALIADTHRP